MSTGPSRSSAVRREAAMVVAAHGGLVAAGQYHAQALRE